MSEEAQHRAVLAAPLDRWRGWVLHVDCGGEACARGRQYDAWSLARCYPGVTLGGVLAKLRCTICKGGAAKVKLTRQPRGKDMEVYWVRR